MRHLLALLADVANGFFALILAALITQTEVIWWHVFVAIPLAMLPDIDAIPELIRRRRVSASAVSPHDHRTFLHIPLIAFPVVSALTLSGSYFALIAAIAIPLHLLNDLYGTGWGLPLMWPFQKTRYKFFTRRVNRLKHQLVASGDWGQLEDSERRLRSVVGWTEEEFQSYVERWGVDDWIPPCYYTCNWLSFTEYTLFILSLAWFVSQLG